MSIKVALEHRTTYRFDRPIDIAPHVIRLRPAPHTRTPIEAYSLTISPENHFLNWQQDPFGNYLARVVFPEKASELDITVGLVADLEVINPFDFFVEDYAETFPFTYASGLRTDLDPYLAPVEDAPGLGLGPVLSGWLDRLPIGKPGPDGSQPGIPIVDFLVALNAAVYGDVAYSVRMEPGVQSPDETLTRAIGSCRDSAWLLVAALRHFGLAARFVSGYLVQLTSDTEPLEGPGGPKEDFTDLHAWAEVFIPGAGWIGLDPTSALFAGEGHIPLAATPHPSHASPITGATEPTRVEFAFANTVTRFHEDPRVTKPYSPEQVAHLQEVGLSVDKIIGDLGLDLTMGGEPTFVSIDDMTSPQWTVAADGPEKRKLADELAVRLFADLAPGGLIQRSQGKWYPGEALPRWQIGLIWRADGEPLWSDPSLLANPFDGPTADDSSAQEQAAAAAERLARLVTERLGLPTDALQACYEDPFAALAAEVARPEGEPPATGDDPLRADPELVSALDAELPAPAAWALPLTPAWWGNGWASARWRFRRGRLVLLPGDSPAGARMPLSSVNWKEPDFEGEEDYTHSGAELSASTPEAVVVDPDETPSRTALVVQARDGIVHLYLPPLEKLEKFAELIGLLDDVVREVGAPVVFEGYGPPPDPRAKVLMVTPDPGVIEVNVHPTSSWTEFSELTAHLYDTARRCRLGTETFGLDGRHSGTGGGNHITLGGPEPARSPLLKRPDLLVSMLTYWQHHPSLSYLFSGRFVGPTSQAPRVDEGRPETLYELEIAFSEVERLVDRPDDEWDHRPWAVDRALRHLLTDITGNTHRAEFCIDKMYSPDSSRGRLGLLELRGFEMPPHPDMALVQALLVRSILARVALDPYRAPLIRWGTRLHERFLLPHFVASDLADVVADLRRHGIDSDLAWFDPYLEFRFPRIGVSQIGDATLELRSAIEPWNVLGEESSSGGTARYVDSSVERVQVVVSGFDTSRYAVTCNSRPVPLQPTGTPGTYVAGVRYKAWKPWSALHPTLEIDSPLVFDVVDLGNQLSLGGATYHVVHPGGRSYEHPPVNAKEAEARRSRRFEASGHTTGAIDVDALSERATWRVGDADEYPLTLDLRRRTPRRWGRG
jgi:uncharacterized protein (DUF2126 family)/transglutaminase-like putative cysteine protease